MDPTPQVLASQVSAAHTSSHVPPAALAGPSPVHPVSLLPTPASTAPTQGRSPVLPVACAGGRGDGRSPDGDTDQVVDVPKADLRAGGPRRPGAVRAGAIRGDPAREPRA